MPDCNRIKTAGNAFRQSVKSFVLSFDTSCGKNCKMQRRKMNKSFALFNNASYILQFLPQCRTQRNTPEPSSSLLPSTTDNIVLLRKASRVRFRFTAVADEVPRSINRPRQDCFPGVPRQHFGVILYAVLFGNYGLKRNNGQASPCAVVSGAERTDVRTGR